MSPCRNVLLQKLKRTHLITRRWMSANVPQPPDEYPENSGWVFEDQSYIIKWFEGSAAPKALDVVYDENIQPPANLNSENDAYCHADNSDEDDVEYRSDEDDVEYRSDEDSEISDADRSDD